MACVVHKLYTSLLALPGLIRVGMDFWFVDVLSHLSLPLVVRVEPPVSICENLIKIQLVRRRVARHQLRLSQRQLVAPVHLPEMVDLPI